MTDAQAGALQELLGRLDAGELGDPLPVLAYLAGQEVEISEEELSEFSNSLSVDLVSGEHPD